MQLLPLYRYDTVQFTDCTSTSQSRAKTQNAWVNRDFSLNSQKTNQQRRTLTRYCSYVTASSTQYWVYVGLVLVGKFNIGNRSKHLFCRERCVHDVAKWGTPFIQYVLSAFYKIIIQTNIEATAIRKNARILDELDVTSAFATLASELNFVKPTISDE